MVSRTKKFRGRNRTHGRGKKAGRGAGKRGGRGLAGINKHRLLTRLIHMPNHWGKHGFNRRPGLRTKHNTINVGELEDLSNQNSNINLEILGITLLLFSFTLLSPLTVEVPSASPSAIAKIEASGGKIVLSGSKNEDSD